MRTPIVGVLGAIAMFAWATVAHIATPLAAIGLQTLPNEAAVVTALHDSLGDKPGLYFFPNARGGDQAAMRAQMEKLRTQPHGLLVYTPPGGTGMSPTQLGTEFTLELIESVLTAVLLAAMAPGFIRRLGMAAAIGVIAAMATNFSYWNWYGFTLDYTLANAFTELMKFVFAGAVIAAVLGWRGRSAG